jgi:hypothetical protein
MNITCPQRFREIGPWERKELIDKWEECWFPGQVTPYHTEYKNGVSKVISTHINWLQAWPKPPLICSFCSCARPDDVFRLLLEEDWEIETTSKSYKFYLHPPGYHVYMRNLIGNVKNVINRLDSFKSPVPPVKGYVWHFSEEEIKELNKLLNKNY